MGELKDRVSKEIIAAMKAKDKKRLDVLRYLKKLYIENDTAKKQQPEIDITIAHAKKIKDSLSMFPEGSTQIDGIKEEIRILSEYLPAQIDEETVIGMIKEIISTHDNPNMGVVMKQLSPKIKGVFEGRRATDLVKSLLS